MRMKMSQAFVGLLIGLTSCRSPTLPAGSSIPGGDGIQRIILCDEIVAPTNFILTPLSKEKDSSRIEIADILQGVTKPLQRPESQLWDRNLDIREKVQPGTLIKSTISAWLPQDLRRTGGRRWQVVEKGLPADAVLLVYVSEMGFQDDAYNAISPTVSPRLAFNALLVRNPPITCLTNWAEYSVALYVDQSSPHPVLWHTNFWIARSSRPRALPGWRRDTYILKPELLKRSLEAICREGSVRIARDLDRALK